MWQVLRPGLVKGQWDAEEDAALMRLATAPFKNWGTLSTQMSGEPCLFSSPSNCEIERFHTMASAAVLTKPLYLHVTTPSCATAVALRDRHHALSLQTANRASHPTDPPNPSIRLRCLSF